MPPLRPLASTPRLLARPTLTLPIRTFTTSTPQQRQTPTHLTVPFDQVPDYPYGPFRWYKQRNVGLYGHAKIRFGNTVSKPHNIKRPTQWRPNRHTKRLWSPALGMFIRTRLTTQVLKTVDKLGGIDEYLMGTKQRRIKELGPAGWRLRWKVMQSPFIQEKWAREREALGLPPKETQMVAGLGGEGEPTVAEMNVVDGMLQRGEEFVLGEEDVLDREAVGEGAVLEEAASYHEALAGEMAKNVTASHEVRQAINEIRERRARKQKTV
ncbi:uncharacterized protein BCR38DRAFT_447658 [Pseudomassariella vexata]|uniref:Ribosomal L28 family-domain-containing protein n=1 Tax=Pseudomassariella vexata TaxID=1141098 RepID=A0A1Y2DH28_9PEZI|nr:uncharacterized protein BCR38DRAFT_447658 [Pseudomassariella vexata]ORY58563.1 hypothetical protein BCR38DRAFT_447658 [Pseudomassariella vexata]